MGDALRRERRVRAWTLERAAAEIGCTPWTLCRCERGRVAVPEWLLRAAATVYRQAGLLTWDPSVALWLRLTDPDGDRPPAGRRVAA